jgi:hypothetical protein
LAFEYEEKWGPFVPGWLPASHAPLPGGLWLPPTYTTQDENLPAGSGLWWLRRLSAQLDARMPYIRRAEEYYHGKHRLAYSTSKWRARFGSLFGGFADNWCPIIVDSPVERMAIEGFRFGAEDPGADKDARSIWQRNNMDAAALLAHTEAVKLGEAAVIVDRGDDGEPRITVEHPSQVIVESSPADRRVRLAALKRWVDEDGYLMATVFLPDRVYKYRSGSAVTTASELVWGPRPGVRQEERNPLGVVPVVPLRNNPTMLAGGCSDLDVVYPLQDAVNKLCNDMIVASEYAAFRQRVMTGVEVPRDPDTGQPITMDLGIDRLFTVAAPDAKVYDLEASDLNNYVVGIELMVRHVAAQTRTPPHYLQGQMVNVSGDALKAAETGLVAKVRRKMLDFGETWEEVMRLAFRVRGDEARGTATDAETIWRNPESRSEGESVDAATKLSVIGLPFRMVLERIGMSQEEIDRAEVLRDEEALKNDLLGLNQPAQQPGVPANGQAQVQQPPAAGQTGPQVSTGG